MFKEGDSVYIKDSAIEDISALAWPYVNLHRNAVIVCEFMNTIKAVDDGARLYVVVWEIPFIGGWHCWHNCKPGYGQIVTGKNMDLNFEASYEECSTIPNIVKPL